jgi:hypothetical protein
VLAAAEPTRPKGNNNYDGEDYNDDENTGDDDEEEEEEKEEKEVEKQDIKLFLILYR